MPLVDIDKGAYKYDSDLSEHWKAIKHWMGISQWHRQDTNNSDLSTPWVDWIVDSCASDIKIMPKSDKVFEECFRKKAEDQEVVMPDFNPKYLSLVEIESIDFKSIYNGSINDSDLRDITQRIGGPIFVINPSKEQILVKMNIEANDTTDKIPYFTCSFGVIVHIDNYKDFVHIVENGGITSFSFHYQLRDSLLLFALHYAEVEMKRLRVKTSFEKCSLEKMCKKIDVLASRIIYYIPQGNGKYIGISDAGIHKKSYNEN